MKTRGFWIFVLVILAFFAVSTMTYAATTMGDNGQVTFSFKAPAGTQMVYLAGNFNNWDPKALPMSDADKDGVWTVTIKLDPGTYQYKFVADGKWYPDPDATAKVDDGYGGYNSVLVVPKPGEQVATVPVATTGLNFDGWFESKIEEGPGWGPNFNNDAWLKFSGSMRGNLKTFTEVHLYLGRNPMLGFSPKDLFLNSAELNQASVSYAWPHLTVKSTYRTNIGTSPDFLALLRADSDSDKLWNANKLEARTGLYGLQTRALAAKDGGNLYLYGETQRSFGPMTVGALLSQETNPGAGGHENGAFNGALWSQWTAPFGLTLKTEAATSWGYNWVPSGQPVPVSVTIRSDGVGGNPKPRPDLSGKKVVLRGSFNSWGGWGGGTDIPCTEVPAGSGIWQATVELQSGTVYEYKFYCVDNGADWGDPNGGNAKLTTPGAVEKRATGNRSAYFAEVSGPAGPMTVKAGLKGAEPGFMDSRGDAGSNYQDRWVGAELKQALGPVSAASVNVTQTVEAQEFQEVKRGFNVSVSLKPGGALTLTPGVDVSEQTDVSKKDANQKNPKSLYTTTSLTLDWGRYGINGWYKLSKLGQLDATAQYHHNYYAAAWMKLPIADDATLTAAYGNDDKNRLDTEDKYTLKLGINF